MKEASLKGTLMSFADHANETTLEAYLAVSTIATETGLNAKTVRRAKAILEKLGLLTDTGKRIGNTGMVHVYRVNIEDSRFVLERLPKYRVKTPNYSGKASQRRETEPIPNPDSTIKEPKQVSYNQTREPIDHELTDSNREEARRIAPGWDLHYLCREYDAWSADKEMPRNRPAAFLGWARKFTKGKPPAGYRQQFGDSLDSYGDDY